MNRSIRQHGKTIMAVGLASLMLLMGPLALATPITVTTTGAPTTIAFPGVKAGDTLTVQATLNTTDPNENGEGEPLVIQSSGGFSAIVSAYAQPRSFSFQATQAGETITISIQGADGDESATVTVDLNQRKRFTQAQKDALAKASADLNTQAAAQTVIAALCLAIPDPSITKICAFGFGLSAGATWLLSGLLNQLALDPSDPNFTVIAQPVTPSFQQVVAGGSVTQAEADSINALLTNLTQAIGLAQATITSINRANGAADAGNSFWETQQLQAAAQYAQQLSSLLGAEPVLRANMVAALQAAGFDPLQVTVSDALNFEFGVASSGLPAFLIDDLTSLGADSAAISQIAQLALVQDVNAMAGTYASIISNANVDTSVLGASKALFDFAIANGAGTPLAQGQMVQGQGFVPDATGDKATFAVEAKVGPDGSISGKLELNDHGTGFSIQHSTITSASILSTGNSAVINGTYQARDGSTGTLQITATQNQGPGSDTISIVLSNGLTISGALGGGNVMIKQ
ncbi:MAG TPA: post-COAP-1 domain-containing protein [Blastocatellia bacterium]|nr:post-COAP-1 domain-containing protein [Blastocatellia bacterium]